PHDHRHLHSFPTRRSSDLVWDRTDSLVASGRVSRTWFWGPGPNTPGLLEQYNESPLGNKLRLVQYFDKSRMEVNNPAADQSQPLDRKSTRLNSSHVSISYA